MGKMKKPNEVASFHKAMTLCVAARSCQFGRYVFELSLCADECAFLFRFVPFSAFCLQRTCCIVYRVCKHRSKRFFFSILPAKTNTFRQSGVCVRATTCARHPFALSLFLKLFYNLFACSYAHLLRNRYAKYSYPVINR